MPVVLDNNKLGAVGEYIKENTKCGAEITISSPIFTIYAFEELLQLRHNDVKHLLNIVAKWLHRLSLIIPLQFELPVTL